jgi:purine-binding chemotaxis protein CheW
MNAKHNSNNIIAADFMPKDEVSQDILMKRSKLLEVKPDVNGGHQISLINYIQFQLGNNELYGIPYEKIMEVMNNFLLTPIPNLPPFIAGIINMRGTLISVINLKILFGMSDAVEVKNSQIIITHKDSMIVGILVDNIIGSDFYDSSLLDLPIASPSITSKFLLGIHQGRTAIINVESILSNLNIDVR